MKQEIKERIAMIQRGEVPEGYKKTKVGVIPNGWSTTQLECKADVIDGDRGKNYPNEKEWVDEGILFLSTKNIKDSKFDFQESRFITKKKFQQLGRGKLQKNDLVITMRGSIGNIAHFNVKDYETAFINAQMAIIRSTKINSDFLWYYLNSDKIQTRLKILSSGSAQLQLTKRDILGLNITLLSRKEQKQIAQILSIWDKAIELKSQLIDEKKEQKKGLMQKLLTGEIRLSGFDGEWGKVKLANMGEIFNGLTGKKASDFGSGQPFITYKNIFANPKIDVNEVDYVHLEDKEMQNTVQYGDVFFTTSSETPNEVGMSSVLLDKVEKMYLNSFCFGLRLYDFAVLLPEFSRYLFRGERFRNSMFKLAQGSTRFNLSKKAFLEIEVVLPPLQEQQTIANILSTADHEIELLEKELELLKEQKKGLMQLLLTGIVRVKEVAV